MQHTFYAVFETPELAAAAVTELDAIGTPRRRCGVIVHRDTLQASELHGGETATRRGAVSGAVAGGALGALFGGLVLGPLGLVGAGAAAAALFGGVVGTAYGGAMGGLAASSGPDPTLETLLGDLRAGKVLVTIEAPGFTSEEEAEQLVLRHGGRVVHRRVV